MDILFAAAEVSPFSKAGGLADVAGALPPALAEMGHSIIVLSPEYQHVSETYSSDLRSGPEGLIQIGPHHHAYAIHRRPDPTLSSLEYWFVHLPAYFNRENIYTDSNGTGYADNFERFLAFQLIAMDLLEKDRLSADLLHCNDHHTALLPLLMAEQDPDLATLLTVHSFLYQGSFTKEETELLPPRIRETLTGSGLPRNALELGVRHASHVNTVSPTYAVEIQSGKWIGESMQEAICAIGDRFSGIMNGIDMHYWSPMEDNYIPAHYGSNDLTRKVQNKLALQKRCHLPPDQTRPVFGSISRLVPNKGFPLLAEILPPLLASHKNDPARSCQFVFLGNGMPEIRDLLLDLNRRYPKQLAFVDDYDEPLAHLIEAGADFFLMPSETEPCGLNQLYSMRYGTPPIVHRTGGLADSVDNWDGSTGSGFVFAPYRPGELLAAIRRAITVFRKPAEMLQLQRAAMEQDHGWQQAALAYDQLYHSLTRGASHARS